MNKVELKVCIFPLIFNVMTDVLTEITWDPLPGIILQRNKVRN